MRNAYWQPLLTTHKTFLAERIEPSMPVKRPRQLYRHLYQTIFRIKVTLICMVRKEYFVSSRFFPGRHTPICFILTARIACS